MTDPSAAPTAEFFASYRLHDTLRAHARTRGTSPAITAGGRTLTWAELDARADQVASALAAAGARPGARVAVLDRNSAEILEVLYGGARIGAVTIPLNWRLAAGEIDAVLRDAEPVALVVHRDLIDGLPADLPGTVVVIGEDGERGYEQWLRAAPVPAPVVPTEPDTPVMQLYTSGTTGKPKGVLSTHRNLGATARSGDGWGLGPDAVALLVMPMFHIGGLSLAFMGLYHGLHLVIARDVVPAEILDTLERERVTHTFLVPTVIGMVLDLPDVAARDLSSLRAILYGASPITPALLRRALDTFRRPLFQVYGLTETHGGITQLHADDHDPGGPREYLLRSAGRALPGVELRTVDPQTGDPTPAGVAGEIHVRYAGVTPGYHNRPEETAAAIDADGWLHTGDIGSIDAEGFLTISDRLKDMIITGGENVYPVEVEAVLAEHPAVAQVAVIGVPHPRWGEEVRAVVVATPGVVADPEDIRRFAKQRLAGYKVPKAVDVVEALPLGPTGKVLKRELRESYLADAGAR